MPIIKKIGFFRYELRTKDISRDLRSRCVSETYIIYEQAPAYPYLPYSIHILWASHRIVWALCHSLEVRWAGWGEIARSLSIHSSNNHSQQIGLPACPVMGKGGIITAPFFNITAVLQGIRIVVFKVLNRNLMQVSLHWNSIHRYSIHAILLWYIGDLNLKFPVHPGCFIHIFFWIASHVLRRWYALQWRHNGRDSVSNHQPHYCLLNRLFRSRSKKTSKLRVTGLCGNSPGVNYPDKWPVTSWTAAIPVMYQWTMLIKPAFSTPPRNIQNTNRWMIISMYLRDQTMWRKYDIATQGDNIYHRIIKVLIIILSIQFLNSSASRCQTNIMIFLTSKYTSSVNV